MSGRTVIPRSLRRASPSGVVGPLAASITYLQSMASAVSSVITPPIAAGTRISHGSVKTAFLSILVAATDTTGQRQNVINSIYSDLLTYPNIWYECFFSWKTFIMSQLDAKSCHVQCASRPKLRNSRLEGRLERAFLICRSHKIIHFCR